MQRYRVRTLSALWLVTICLAASGCISHQVLWHYWAGPTVPAAQPLTEKRLVVLPFHDLRPRLNTDASALGLIPLMPYGWIDYSLPETGRDGPLYERDAGQFKPREDLARAAAEELGATGMFTEVVMAPSASENDLVLRGEVTSTRYYVTLLAYGLSAAVGAAWLIGLPAGRITNELTVAFSLEESRTRTVRWHKAYAEKYTATYWLLYYMPPEFNYSALYKTILRDVVENIRMELERHP